MLKVVSNTKNSSTLNTDLKAVDFAGCWGYQLGTPLTWGCDSKTGQVVIFDATGQPWRPSSSNKNKGIKEVEYLLDRHTIKKLDKPVRLVRERQCLANDLDSNYEKSEQFPNLAYAACWEVRKRVVTVWDQNGRAWIKPLRKGIGRWLWPRRVAKREVGYLNHDLKEV